MNIILEASCSIKDAQLFDLVQAIPLIFLENFSLLPSPSISTTLSHIFLILKQNKWKKKQLQQPQTPSLTPRFNYKTKFFATLAVLRSPLSHIYLFLSSFPHGSPLPYTMRTMSLFQFLNLVSLRRYLFHTQL